MHPHVKPFDINDYAHRKVRYILREAHGNQDLVHTIRDHYFPVTSSCRSPPWWRLSKFVRDVEAGELTVGGSSWNSTGLGRMCLMPKRSRPRGSQIPTKKPLGYKRTKDGVDMVFSNTDFIHPKDMTVELMRDRGLNARSRGCVMPCTT